MKSDSYCLSYVSICFNLRNNFLNLLSGVIQSGSRVATYAYASDGTKLSVVGADGRGYEYYGSLIYQINGSSLTFESAGFNEGRIYSGGAYYHVKDHLGSIRLVMDQTGSVKEQNDYYPFGMRQERSNYALFAGNRFKYNGKEEQTTGGLGYLDYGARMYDAESGRWFGVDPLSEKYYGISPYAYCGNNPLKYVDPDGRRFDDYFSFLGKYLGSDGKPTSYVRVTSEEEWEKNVKISTDGEKTIFQVDDAMNSVLHSESNISEEASLNIYDHYNMTGLPLSVNENSKGAGMNFKVENGKISIQIKLAGNKKLGFSDNANDIINSFVHENKHYMDYKKLGNKEYHKVPQRERELNAVFTQMKHESFNKASPAFQKAIKKILNGYLD